VFRGAAHFMARTGRAEEGRTRKKEEEEEALLWIFPRGQYICPSIENDKISFWTQDNIFCQR
jgi:hypothetical protein